jgi:plastocyanin
MSVRSTLRRHPATAVPAIALAGVALAAAGCGSSNDNKSSSSSNSGGGTAAPKKAAPSAAGVVTQSATEFKFSKPAATAKAGKVSIKLTNDGQVGHAIEIEGAPGGDKRSAVIQPGQNTTLTANLKPGKYEFYCPVDSHKQMGMKGELTVK